MTGTPQESDAPSSIEEGASPRRGISRRGLLGLAGAGVVGAGVGLGVDRFALPHDSLASSGAAASYICIRIAVLANEPLTEVPSRSIAPPRGSSAGAKQE